MASEWEPMSREEVMALECRASIDIKRLIATIHNLEEKLANLVAAFYGAWIDHGYSAEALGEEYDAACALLAPPKEPADE
jgi:hypothetical protein